MFTFGVHARVNFGVYVLVLVIVIDIEGLDINL